MSTNQIRIVDPSKILSIGAGAIGTYISGSLALNGHKVTFLEQPHIAKELKEKNLRLNLHGQEYEVSDFSITSSIKEAISSSSFDLAIFALKSYDTVAAINSMAAHADALPPFLCLQNGVDNEPALANVLGADKVIPGTVTSAIGRRAAGDIILERLRGMGVAAGHPISERLVSALRTAGLNASLYPKAPDMKWSKMLTNLVSNASSAILDMPPAEIFAHPELFKLEITQLRECLAVMRAQGISTVNLPGTPVKALAFAAHYLPLSIARPLMGRAVGGGRGGKMPSFHIDLHSGRGKSEVDYLNGAVVRAGEKLGIHTPANRLLKDTLINLTSNKLNIEDFSKKPASLLKSM